MKEYFIVSISNSSLILVKAERSDVLKINSKSGQITNFVPIAVKAIPVDGRERIKLMPSLADGPFSDQEKVVQIVNNQLFYFPDGEGSSDSYPFETLAFKMENFVCLGTENDYDDDSAKLLMELSDSLSAFEKFQKK